jgi:hypothetical protein
MVIVLPALSTILQFHHNLFVIAAIRVVIGTTQAFGLLRNEKRGKMGE